MPRVAVLAGINGAGKTTASFDLLTRVLKIPTFVNADEIARGLNGLNPESEAYRAGRIMLERLNFLVDRDESFAFETTLAARTYASWLRDLKQSGYEIYLLYYWLESADLAVSRVAGRVRAGGHSVPEHTIRQRYARSVRNFFELYRPLADVWEVNENSGVDKRLIGCGFGEYDTIIIDRNRWDEFERIGDYG